MGMRVRATASEASSANDTVRAMSRKSWAAIPCRKTTGRKTATVVNVEAASAASVAELKMVMNTCLMVEHRRI